MSNAVELSSLVSSVYTVCCAASIVDQLREASGSPAWNNFVALPILRVEPVQDDMTNELGKLCLDSFKDNGPTRTFKTL